MLASLTNLRTMVILYPLAAHATIEEFSGETTDHEGRLLALEAACRGALEALSMPNSAITPQQCRSCAQPHSALLLQDILLTPVTGA